jgi:hypothetical protein
MAQDPSLAFAQNLVNRYMQFKAQQFQVEMFRRREQRYERQLQENRLHRQKQLALQERGVVSLERLRGGSPFSITTPSQIKNISDIVAEEFTNVTPVETWWGLGKGRIPAAETRKAIDRIKRRTFYTEVSDAERDSIDAAIEGRISGGFEKKTIEPPPTQPKLIFRGYGERGRTEAPAFTPTPEQKVGDTITRGGKQWRIVGFDTDGEPLVELVQ